MARRPETPNYYAVLGVPPTASLQEVRKAYKERALRSHPDRCASRGGMREATPEVQVATETFKLVGEAYSILTDNDRRTAYDVEFGFVPPPNEPPVNVDILFPDRPNTCAAERPRAQPHAQRPPACPRRRQSVPESTHSFDYVPDELRFPSQQHFFSQTFSETSPFPTTQTRRSTPSSGFRPKDGRHDSKISDEMRSQWDQSFQLDSRGGIRRRPASRLDSRQSSSNQQSMQQQTKSRGGDHLRQHQRTGQGSAARQVQLRRETLMSGNRSQSSFSQRLMKDEEQRSPDVLPRLQRKRSNLNPGQRIEEARRRTQEIFFGDILS